MRRGEEGRIGLIVLFVGLAVRFFAVPQVRDEFAVCVEDGHASGQIGNVKLALVLIETAGLRTSPARVRLY